MSVTILYLGGALFSGHSVYNRFDRIPACNGQTDERTDILRRYSSRNAHIRAVKIEELHKLQEARFMFRVHK